MAISDKVIDLAPVKKGRTIIFLVVIGVLAAASVAFSLLWIFKPAYIPTAVNNIIVQNNLFQEPNSEKLTAAVNGKYMLTADVGADESADTSVVWEVMVSNSPSDLIKGESFPDEKIANRYNYVFTVLPGAEGREVTIIAKSLLTQSVYTSVTFTVKEEYADSVSITKLVQGSKVYENNGEIELPFFETVVNNYEIFANVLGGLDKQGNRAQISSGYTVPGFDKQVNALTFTSDNPSIVTVLPYDGLNNKATVSLKKAGEANITVTANTYNNAENKPIAVVKLKVKTLEQLGKISSINFIPGGKSFDIFVGENTTKNAYDIRPNIKVTPADKFPDPFKTNLRVYVSDALGNAKEGALIRIGEQTLIQPTGNSTGTEYVTIKDTSPDGYGTYLILTVNVKIPIKGEAYSASTLYDREKITKENPVPAARSDSKTIYLKFSPKINISLDKASYYLINSTMTVSYIQGVKPKFDGKTITNANDCVVVETMNSDFAVSPQIGIGTNVFTAPLVLKLGNNVENGTVQIRFTLSSQTSSISDAETFDVFFTISQEAAAFEFNYGYDFKNPYTKLIYGPPDQFTYNLSRENTSYSIFDFIIYKDKNGNIIENELEGGYVKTNPNTLKTKITIQCSETNMAAIFVNPTTSNSKPSDFQFKGLQSGHKCSNDDIIITLSTTGGGSYEKKLKLLVLDNVKDISLDVNASAKREIIYDATVAQGGKEIGNFANDTITQYFIYGGINANPPATNTYFVNIAIRNGSIREYLFKKSISGVDYYFDASLAEGERKPVNALFFKNGSGVSINRDLYGISVERNKAYGNFDIVYSLIDITWTGTEANVPEINTSASYTAIRKLDEIRVYKSNNYLDGEVIQSLSVNKGTDFNMYPSGIVVSMVNGVQTEFVINRPGAKSYKVQSLILPSSSSPSILSVGSSFDSFHAIGEAGVTRQATVTFMADTSYGDGIKPSDLKIVVTIDDNALPIDSIQLYSDSAYKNLITEESYKIKLASLGSGLSDSITIYYKIIYKEFNGKFTMLDGVTFFVGANLTLSGETKPIDKIENLPDGSFDENNIYRFEGQFTLTAKTINGPQTAYVKSKANTAGTTNPVESVKVSVEVVTPAIGATLTFNGQNYSSASQNTTPIVLNIANDAGAPKNQAVSIALSYNSLNGAAVSTENLTVSFDSVAGLLISKKENTSFVVTGIDVSSDLKVGSYNLVIKIKEEISQLARDVVYTIYIPVKVTSDTYKVELLDGAGGNLLPSINLTTDGKSTSDLSYNLFSRINGGNPDLAPTNKDIIYKITDAAGAMISDSPFRIDTATLKIANTEINTKSKTYYVTAFSGAVKSAPVPILLTTTKEEIKFNSALGGENRASVNSFDGKDIELKCLIYNAGTKALISVANDAIVYTVSKNPSLGRLEGSVLKILGASGTMEVTVSYTAANNERLTAVATININNRVKFVEIDYSKIPHADQVNSKWTVTMLKGSSFDFSGVVTLKNADGGEPFSQGYTLMSSDSIVVGTHAGNYIIDALATGTITLTITANKAVNDTEAAATATITIEVKDVKLTSSSAEVSLELMDNDSAGKDITFGISDDKFNIDNSGELFTVTPESDKIIIEKVSAYIYKVSLDKSKFQTPSDLTKNYIVNFTAVVDGITLKSSFIVKVTATYIPEVALYKDGVIDTDNTVDSGKAGVVFSAKVTNELSDSQVLYSVSPSSLASIDETTGKLSFKGVGAVTISAKVVKYGITFSSSVNRTFTVINTSKITTKLFENNLDGNLIEEGAAISIDYDGAVLQQKVVYAVIYYTDVNYVFNTGDEDKFFLTVSGSSLVKDGAPTLNIAKKRYEQKYLVVSSGTVSFNATVIIDGVSYLAVTSSLTLNSTPPDFQVSASKEAINPGESSVITASITSLNNKFAGDVTVNFSMLSGVGIATINSSGKTATVTAPKGSLGGRVTVEVKFIVTSGVYRGLVGYMSQIIDVNSYAQPTVTVTKIENITKNIKPNLNDFISVTSDIGDTAFAYKNEYVIDAKYGSISNGILSVVSGNLSFVIAVKSSVTGGFFAGKTFDSVITVTVVPDLVITAKKNSGDTPIVKAADLTAGTSLTLSANIGEAVGDMTVVYSVPNENLGYISGNKFHSNLKTAGGTVTVTATAIVTSGAFNKAKLTATFDITVLSVNSDTTIKYAPGASFNLQNIASSIGLKLNSTPYSSGTITINSESNKVTINGSSVTIKQNANFSGSDIDIELFVEIDLAGKIYFDILTLTISSVASPTIAIEKYSINGGAEKTDAISNLFQGDTLKIFVKSASAITSTTLSSDKPLGVITGSSSNYVEIKIPSDAMSDDYVLTISSVIFGDIYSLQINVNVSAKTANVFTITNGFAEVAQNTIQTVTLTRNSSVKDLYYIEFNYSTNHFSKVELFDATVSKTSSTNGSLYFYNNNSPITNPVLKFTVKNTASTSIQTINYSIYYHTTSGGSYNGYSTSPSSSINIVGETLDNSKVKLSADKMAVRMGDKIKVSVNVPNFTITTLSYNSSANLVVDQDGNVSCKTPNVSVVTGTVNVTVTAGGKTGLSSTTQLTLNFVPSPSIKLDNANNSTIVKGASPALTLSNGQTGVTYLSGDETIASVTGGNILTAKQAGEFTLEASYKVGGVTFTESKVITVIDTPVLTVLQQGNIYTLTVFDNVVYKAEILSGLEFGSFTNVNNVFTFIPKTDTKGGAVIVVFSATFTSGVYKDIVLSQTKSIAVDGVDSPTLVAEAKDGVFTHTINYNVSKYEYEVLSNVNYITIDTTNSLNATYALKKSSVDRQIIIKVKAFIDEAPYAGAIIETIVVINLTAEVKPNLTVNETSGKLVGSITADNVSYTYEVISGSANLSVDENGTLTKVPGKTTVIGVVQVTATITYGDKDGFVIVVNKEITIDGVEAPKFLSAKGENGTFIFTFTDGYTVGEYEYTVQNNAGYIVIPSNSLNTSYTLNQSSIDREIVVKVTATLIKEGDPYNNARVETIVTINLTAEVKPTLNVSETNGKLEGSITGDNVSYTYEVISGSANLSVDENGTLTKVPGKTTVTGVVQVTATITYGDKDSFVIVVNKEVTIDGVEAPKFLSAKGENGTFIFTFTDGYTASEYQYTVQNNVGYIVIPSNSLNTSYTLNQSSIDREIVVKVTATLVKEGDPYNNARVETIVTINLTAEVKPTLNVSETNGKLVGSITGDNVSYTYSLISGSANLSVDENGTLTKTPGKTTVTGVVQVTATITYGDKDSFVIVVNKEVTIDAALELTFTSEIENEIANVSGQFKNTIGNGYTASSIEYEVQSNASFITIDKTNPLLVSYSLKKSNFDRVIIVKVTATIIEAPYNNARIESFVTINLVAEAPTLTVTEKSGFVSALLENVVEGADVQYTYEVTEGNANLSVDEKGKLSKTAAKTPVTAKVKVTAKLTYRLEGEEKTLTDSIDVEIPAAKEATFTSEIENEIANVSGKFKNAVGNGYTATNIEYEVQSNASYITINQLNGTYTLSASGTDREVVVKVTATIFEAPYNGARIEAVVTIHISAATPILAVSENTGSLTAAVQNTPSISSVTYSYAVTEGNSNLSINSDGTNLVKIPGRTTVTATVKVTATITYAVGDIQTLTKDIEITIAPAKEATFISEIENEIANVSGKFKNMVGNGYTATSFEYETQSAYIEINDVDGTYKLLPSGTDREIVVKVTATISEAPYENARIDSIVVIKLTATQKQPLTIKEEGGKLVGSIEENVVYAYEVISGDENLSINSDGTNLVKKPGKTTVTALVQVSAVVTFGPGDTHEYFIIQKVEISAEAAIAFSLSNIEGEQKINANLNKTATYSFRAQNGNLVITHSNPTDSFATYKFNAYSGETIVVTVTATIFGGAFDTDVVTETISITCPNIDVTSVYDKDAQSITFANNSINGTFEEVFGYNITNSASGVYLVIKTGDESVINELSLKFTFNLGDEYENSFTITINITYVPTVTEP